MNKATFNAEHQQLLEEKHQNTIKNIQELQEMEKYMYQNLESLNAGGNSTQGEEDQIVNRINELTQMRINLFTQLKQQYGSTANELNNDRKALKDQVATVGIVEDELNKAKQNYRALVNEKNNKLRMVEIGTYQSDRYSAHIGVMKIIAIASVIVLVASVLLQRGLLPGRVVSGIIIITVAVAIILVIRKVLDLSSRSNLVYDQYNWGANHSELQPGYQGVLAYDESFFKKLGGEVEHGATQAVSDVKSGVSQATSMVKSATSQISSMTDSSSSTSAPSKQVVVSPNQPKGIENFATYY